MSVLFLGCAVLILISLLLGLIRVGRGPTHADRMVAAQLFTSAGIAIVLLLGEASATPALRDVALVFALVAVIATVAFVQRAWRPPAEPGERDDGGR